MSSEKDGEGEGDDASSDDGDNGDDGDGDGPGPRDGHPSPIPDDQILDLFGQRDDPQDRRGTAPPLRGNQLALDNNAQELQLLQATSTSKYVVSALPSKFSRWKTVRYLQTKSSKSMLPPSKMVRSSSAPATSRVLRCAVGMGPGL